MSDDLERRLQDLLEQRATVTSATRDRVLGSIDGLPSRGVRARQILGPVSIGAAIVVLTIIGLTSAVSQRPPTVLAPSATPSSPAPTLQLRPVWAIDVESHLECDGPPSSIGLDVTMESAASSDVAYVTPDAAFHAIRSDYPMLPATGFTPILTDDHWALQRYVVDGRPKVHIVATDQVPGISSGTGWRVVGIRTCDPAEY